MPPKPADAEAAARQESFKDFRVWWAATNEYWTEVPEAYTGRIFPEVLDSGTPLSTEEEGEE